MRGPRAFLLAIVASSALRAGAALPRGEVVPDVACLRAPGRSYALYLPSGCGPARRCGVLYLLDPRGRGTEPMARVVPAAERLGFVVASANGPRGEGPLDPFRDAFLAMVADTRERFAIDDARVVIGGFSAGARAASFLAQVLRTPPLGVIACGAGFLDERPPARGDRFAWFGIVGTRDFNHAEMKRTAARLSELGLRPRLVEFDGAHEWPPADALGEALAWMEALARVRAGAAAPEIVAEMRERARADEAAGRPLSALERYEALARDLGAAGDVSEARTRAEALRAAPEVARRAREEARRDEREARLLGRLEGVLRARFADEPAPPLGRLLGDLGVPGLKRRAAGDADAAERLSAARVLEALRVRLAVSLAPDFEAAGDLRRAALARGAADACRP